jgi:hypothetical protein
MSIANTTSCVKAHVIVSFGYGSPRQMRKLVLIVLGTTLALIADDRSNRTLSVTHSDRFNVPASASVSLENSFGEIDVEGWDLPEVEVTVSKSVEELAGEKGQAARQRLDSVQVATKHKEGDTVIATVYPEQRGLWHLFDRRGDVKVSYRIHAPRGSKLFIEHGTGGLNVAGIIADIHGTVDRGQITLTLPDGHYAIDAKCKTGRVYSDFEGQDKRRHMIGDEFNRPNAPLTPNLYLRTGFGDVIILKANHSLRTE